MTMKYEPSLEPPVVHLHRIGVGQPGGGLGLGPEAFHGVALAGGQFLRQHFDRNRTAENLVPEAEDLTMPPEPMRAATR